MVAKATAEKLGWKQVTVPTGNEVVGWKSMRGLPRPPELEAKMAQMPPIDFLPCGCPEKDRNGIMRIPHLCCICGRTESDSGWVRKAGVAVSVEWREQMAPCPCTAS